MTGKVDRHVAALRLLKGIARELRDLANDTATFGEALANEAKLGDQSVGLLQQFDIFTQNLRAHALLIADLSMRLEDGSADASELSQLIEHVPFYAIRSRLREVLHGASGGTEPKEDDSDESWF